MHKKSNIDEETSDIMESSREKWSSYTDIYISIQIYCLFFFINITYLVIPPFTNTEALEGQMCHHQCSSSRELFSTRQLPQQGSASPSNNNRCFFFSPSPFLHPTVAELTVAPWPSLILTKAQHFMEDAQLGRKNKEKGIVEFWRKTEHR